MWVFDPRGGGQKIPLVFQDEIRRRILNHAAKTVPDKASQLRLRFRGHCCYIDVVEPDSPEPMRLCRLRYMGRFREPRAWAVDFYTYSHERYEPSVFMSGEWLGTPEEGLEIGATCLQ